MLKQIKLLIPDRFYRVRAISSALFLAILLVGSSGSSILSPLKKIGIASAQCNSIAECNAQINSNNNAVAELRNQATSYQDAIKHLQAQIGQLQGAISANQAEQASLLQQITDAQNKIIQQKKYLGQNITSMYIDGQLSTIEELATSKNISDFVDKEEYRIIAQGKIDSTINEIARLQKQLQDQKVQVESLLQQQQQQQGQLVTARQEQQQLVSYNAGQQASYNADTSANKQKLAQLIAAQRRANNSSASLYFLRFPGEVQNFNPEAYPYADSGFGMSTAPGCVDNDGPDPWGYCYRQCVSYAAWAVKASGRSAPMFYGNAKDWVRRSTVPVYTSNPLPGDVVITTGGTWGHAMYVEEVSGNRVRVSEYNQQLSGTLRTDRWLSY